MPNSNPKTEISKPRWELDGRETRFIFGAAEAKAKEAITRLRMELIELKHYDPQPQTISNGEPAMFDRKSKADIIAETEQWLAYYEKIRLFSMRMNDYVMHIEAEKFGQEMAELFRERKEK